VYPSVILLEIGDIPDVYMNSVFELVYFKKKGSFAKNYILLVN